MSTHFRIEDADALDLSEAQLSWEEESKLPTAYSRELMMQIGKNADISKLDPDGILFRSSPT